MKQPVLDEHDVEIERPTTFRGAQASCSSGDEHQAQADAHEHVEADAHDPDAHLRAVAKGNLYVGLETPTDAFARDLAHLIRTTGALPTLAAQHLGVPKARFLRWLKTPKAGAYDTLRAHIRSATAAHKLKLHAEITKKHPEIALRRIETREENAAQGRANQPRPYLRHGLSSLLRSPQPLVERVTDSTLADDQLAPVEQAAREWRRQMLADLGDAVPTTKLILVNATVGTLILLLSVDAYLAELGEREGVVNRKHRRTHVVVEQRMRIADTLALSSATSGRLRISLHTGKGVERTE